MERLSVTEISASELREQISGQTPYATVVSHELRSSSFSTVILPAMLLLAYLAQCAWFIQTQSFTFDEPINILSGLEEWRTGQYSGGAGMTDHPPLARLLCTLPVISSRFQIREKVVPNPESVAWHNSDFESFGRVLPDPQAVAWRTRSVNAIMGAALGLLLWLAARRLYSVNAANFVLGLFALSPSLIAHFSLAATNDGAMTLMLFATAFQLCRWYRDRSWVQTVLLGTVLGALLITKASAVPLFGVAIALLLVLKNGIAIRPSEWNWRQASTAFAISVLIVWGSYRFHVSKLTLMADDVHMRVTVPNRPDPITRDFSHAFHVSLPVPGFEFIRALAFQLSHAKKGHPAFLLGRSYMGGSTWYFPIVMLLKWPTMVLVSFLLAIGLILLRWTSLLRDFALWMVFPVLYLGLAEFSSLNLGERYILPIYPFVLLLCGSLWQFVSGRRAALALVLVAGVVHVGDVLRYAPDYLSYFNLFVPPGNGYKLLSDSNVDWGQGLIALRMYQKEHLDTPIHLAYFGNVDPGMYGIRAIPLMPSERTSGTVIISANYLSGQTLPDPNSYHWVLQYPLRLILNHSLYVFEVPNQAK
jgi:4-amino-4-deoxy-L-arabinose transferase-like glycosyltransferase